MAEQKKKTDKKLRAHKSIPNHRKLRNAKHQKKIKALAEARRETKGIRDQLRDLGRIPLPARQIFTMLKQGDGWFQIAQACQKKVA